MGVLETVGQEGLFDGAAPLSSSVPAPLSSLGALDQRLARLGTDLYRRVGGQDDSGTYLGASNDMLEALKTAGKKYQETDDSSADEFDMDSVIPPASIDVTLASHSGEIFSSGFHLDRLTNAELTVPAGIDLEDHEEQFYSTLYALGDYIRTYGLAGLYEAKGTKWFRLGDSLLEAKGALNNNLVGITANAWEGTGVDGLIAASEQYGTQIDSLVEAMWRVADAYRFAALWLEETQQAMPQDPHNYMGTYRDEAEGRAPYLYIDEDRLGEEYGKIYQDVTFYDEAQGQEVTEAVVLIQDPTPYYREKFKETYLAGFIDTDQYFPLLPSYTPGTDPSATESPPLVDEEDDNTYQDNGGFDPDAGAGGYTPTGAGSAVPTGEEWESEWPGQAAADAELTEWEQAQEEAAQQQVSQLGTQAIQQGMSAVQDALGAVEQSLADTGMPIGALPPGLPLGIEPTRSAGLPAFKTGGPGGSLGNGTSSTAGNGPGVSKPATDPARLFPRAALPGANTPFAGAAGQQASGMPASGMPMGGSPGGSPGAAGGRGGQGDDKHERAKYLDRADNLDEGLGDPLDMSRPVVGESGARPAAAERVQPPAAPRPVAPRPEPVRPSRSEEPVILPRREGA
ncbi:hypothetical protein [Nocardia jinanensis]|nr:hypothetical protein [Nocardia jinanensis]